MPGTLPGATVGCWCLRKVAAQSCVQTQDAREGHPPQLLDLRQLNRIAPASRRSEGEPSSDSTGSARPIATLPPVWAWVRFYLFIRERHTDRGRDTGRGRSRLRMGSLMQDSIPRPRDYDLSQRQILNHLTTQMSLTSVSSFRSLELISKWEHLGKRN